VTFSEVEGMTELNSLPPTPVNVVNPYTVELDVDSTNFSKYTYNGLMELTKVPKIVQYKSYVESTRTPLGEKFPNNELMCVDWSRPKYPSQLHIVCQAVR
jgi:hypothetical protein